MRWTVRLTRPHWTAKPINLNFDKKADQTALNTKADKSALGNYIAKTGGSLTGTLHFDGKGKSGGEQRSAGSWYNPYAGGDMRTEFYGVDIVGQRFEHRLILGKGNDLKWFVFQHDDGNAPCPSLFRNLCICLILICSIQHQKQVNLWTKNSCRLWLTNWPKISKPLKISVTSIGC
ncbi:hypothetical protein [Candidatus Sodalis pierantonius]|uniref:hypothetical protein n=1 Tax=Candidatus Sodalis pierantonii TaxID=1486991 RepID=UPI0011DDC50C|nr:hypothetical protein [Candidatus Sodalis pierantonius]